MSAIDDWLRDRTHHHSRFPVEGLADGAETVSVCVSTRECARTIGPIAAALAGLRDAGAIDQALVVDAGSRDGTAGIAARAGVEVVQEAELRPQAGPVLGKGDAMWRALEALSGEIVCFVDGDSEDFAPHYVSALAGPLLDDPRLALVKATYRRPFRAQGIELPDGGGRVSQLTARPLLTMFYPQLAALEQPLAGDVAARRELLERIPIVTGYGVEVAMLIDTYRERGLDAIAQVDLGVRHNRHQSLPALAPMAWDVLQAVVARLEREGRLDAVSPGELRVPGLAGARARAGELIERPPARVPA